MAPLNTRYIEIAGTLCIFPAGITHDLGQLQAALEDMDKFGVTPAW